MTQEEYPQENINQTLQKKSRWNRLPVWVKGGIASIILCFVWVIILIPLGGTSSGDPRLPFAFLPVFIPLLILSNYDLHFLGRIVAPIVAFLFIIIFYFFPGAIVNIIINHFGGIKYFKQTHRKLYWILFWLVILLPVIIFGAIIIIPQIKSQIIAPYIIAPMQKKIGGCEAITVDIRQRNDCFWKQANMENNIEICSKIEPGMNARDYCFIGFLRRTKDASICNRLSESPPLYGNDRGLCQ